MGCEWSAVVSPDAARPAAGDDIGWMQGVTTAVGQVEDEHERKAKQGEEET